MFKFIVLAVAPLYEPEKVIEESPAESEAKSFVNQDRLGVEDDIVFNFPFEPMYANPCERSVNFAPFIVVEENDIIPLAKLNIVEVDTP
jgi:hypothetical protein